VRLAEAPSHGMPALLYDVKSRGAESYIRLAKELMDRLLPKAAEIPAIAVASNESAIEPLAEAAVEDREGGAARN
jgi:hypothetical protein